MPKIYLRFLCGITSVLLFILVPMGAFAQNNHGTLEISIKDSSSLTPLDAANVAIINIRDSLIVRHIISKNEKNVVISDIPNGSYVVLVAEIGYIPKKASFKVTDENPHVILPDLLMSIKINSLAEIKVIGEKDPLVIKKDTLQYDATIIKTQVNDNVEELLKKIPIIDIDKNGNILVNGQQVTKILVEGKEFFGDDIKAATKNLTADAISAVQIIDEKSNNTKRGGIDDGQRDKIINLKLKADNKNALFGNAILSVGTHDRYLGQLNLNYFGTKNQLSFISLTNNENESGFSLADLNSFTNGNINSLTPNSNRLNVSSNSNGTNASVFAGVNGGLITTHSGGLNYSTQFGKNETIKFNANLIAVISSNSIIESVITQAPVNNGYQSTYDYNTGANENKTYRLNISMDYQLDSLTSIVFKPNAVLNYKSTINNVIFNTSDQNQTLINSGNQSFDQSSNVSTIGGQLSINHQFLPSASSLGLLVDGNYFVSPGHYINNYNNKFYTTNTDSLFNQQTTETAKAKYINSNISYSIPINKEKQIGVILSQEFDYQNNSYNQITLNYDPITGKYDTLAPMFSGNIANHQTDIYSSIGLSKSTDLYSLNINFKIENLGLSGDFKNASEFNNIAINKWTFLPNASFSYRKLGVFISANLQLTSQLPSLNELLPLLNNTNPLIVQLGNPNLKSNNISTFTFIYNNFNVVRKSSLNIFLNASYINNAFSTASDIDSKTGIQTNQTINTNGNYSYQFGINLSSPTGIKALKIRYGLIYNLTNSVNFINDNQNSVMNTFYGVNATLYYDSKSTQVSLYNNSSYNNALNSFQQSANQHYFSFTSNIKFSQNLFPTARVSVDASDLIYKGSQGYLNNNYLLINGGLEKYFLPKKQLSLSLNVHDLLNQNKNITHTINSIGQIQNTQTNTIGRYIFLKINYKILRRSTSQ